jgi:glycerate dehydrogenase
LLSAQNCVITPHVAWAAKEARERLIRIVAENLRRYQEGRPQNVVS